MGVASRSQPLKSPMMVTLGALGAQTRNKYPSVPSSAWAGWAPKHFQAWVERPSEKASSSKNRSEGERFSRYLDIFITSNDFL